MSHPDRRHGTSLDINGDVLHVGDHVVDTAPDQFCEEEGLPPALLTVVSIDGLGVTVKSGAGYSTMPGKYFYKLKRGEQPQMKHRRKKSAGYGDDLFGNY